MSENISSVVNLDGVTRSLKTFNSVEPFSHCIIDNFFLLDIAHELEREFPAYDDSRWFCYKNQLEDKKTYNIWGDFPAITYKVFTQLNGREFIEILDLQTNCTLFSDPGLHGAGWSIHGTDGNLNPHLDYSIHPKLKLQRKLNLIVYLANDLKTEHGGHLGLWAHDSATNQPGELVVEVQPIFNRAIIFDASQNSWHGMSRALCQPDGIFRKSIAAYYLTVPPDGVPERERALYAPRENQRGDQTVLDLIKARTDAKDYSSAYRTEE